MLSLLAALAAQVAAPSMGRSGGSAPAAKVAWSTREQDIVVKDFRFRDGEVLPALKGRLELVITRLQRGAQCRRPIPIGSGLWAALVPIECPLVDA